MVFHATIVTIASSLLLFFFPFFAWIRCSCRALCDFSLLSLHSFPYPFSPPLDIAALREFFASQPVTVPAAASAVAASADGTAASATSLMRASSTSYGGSSSGRLPKKAESQLVTTVDSVQEEFFDAVPDAGPDSELTKKVRCSDCSRARGVM